MSSEILSDERIRRFNLDSDPVKEKMKLKGGKKFRRKNLFMGDFDVFASCSLSSLHVLRR